MVKNNNNNNSLMIALMLFILIIFLIFLAKNGGSFCGSEEKFGQDASLRVGSGWLSGPSGGMYGYDPVDYFSKQISRMDNRTKYNTLAEKNNVEKIDNTRYKPEGECKSCMSTEDFEN
jgi:hypothetical protein